MNGFVSRIPVRFEHCDSAGIVFYPRYFEMINNVVEDWFAELGCDFHHMHFERREGVPAVRSECDFLQPSRLGDVLEFELVLSRIGRSSFTLQITARSGGEERLRARMVLAYVSLDPAPRGKPIPDSVRSAMQAYLRDEAPRS